MESETGRTAVYFDGACPICRREIAHYRGLAGADAIEWIDVARCGDEALAPGLSRPAALARLHVRTAGGRLESGAAAFAALWRALPGWAWLGRIVGTWPVTPVAELAYRTFLRLRRLWR